MMFWSRSTSEGLGKQNAKSAISSGLAPHCARRLHFGKSSAPRETCIRAAQTVTSLINRHDVARLRRKVELPVHPASAQHQRTHPHDPPRSRAPSNTQFCPRPCVDTESRRRTHFEADMKPEKNSVDMTFYRLMASRRSCTP